jgi:hypothetical protein
LAVIADTKVTGGKYKKTATPKKREPAQKKKCISCPEGSAEQNVSNFFISKSIWHSDGYLPICKSCIIKRCYDPKEDEISVDALKDVLRQVDKPYNDVAYQGAIDQYNKQYAGQDVPPGSRAKIIGLYFKTINSLSQYVGLNWKTGVEFNNKQNTQSANGVVTVLEDKYEPKARTKGDEKFYLEEDETFVVTTDLLRRFGTAYVASEYRELDLHYKMLKEQATSDDIVTDSLIKDLCAIKIQQNRALQSGSVDQYEKLTKLYQSTLSSANLNPKGVKDNPNASQECFGLWIKEIEKYAPADYFKDKAIYKDHDGLGEYFQRFIVRPFRNLITGTKELDPEFSIGQAQTGDDLDVTS